MIGRKTDITCSNCNKYMYGNGEEWWCSCGNSTDLDLTKFITNMNRIVEHKKSQDKLDMCHLCFGKILLFVAVLWILVFIFWYVVF